MILIAAIAAAFLYVPPPWGIVLVLGATVIEVGETLFWIRLSRRRRIQMGAETLVGAEGVVTRACRPLGQVRVAGELWQARCHPGADVGERIRVDGRSGLVLVVQPVTAGK